MSLIQTSIVSCLPLPLQSLPIWLAACAGTVAHRAVFIYGEWHLLAPDVFVGSLVTILALTLLGLLSGADALESVHITWRMTATFTASILLNIAIYRRLFHRLRHFDGPALAGITKFWHVWKCLDSKNHLVLDRLHKRYGPWVRTGPSELTCFLPDVLPAIDGPGSTCGKSAWYDLLLPAVAVNTTRDRTAHDKRRRIWDRGFTSKALDEYQKRIVEYAHMLEQRISDASSQSKAVDVSVLFYWFTFDVMGEFAFGKSFRMLEDERWHFAVVLLRRAMSLLGPLSPAPWLANIAIGRLPWFWVVKDWLRMLDWCHDRMRERMANGSDRPDVAQYLIDASEKNDTVQQDLPWLFGDAVTIIIAGSDTAAPTLVYTFYELVLEHSRQSRIREELEGVDIYDHKALEGCQYINGVLNEVFRLHPPVPTHGHRLTPAEGLQVGDTYIPGDVTIVTPRWSFGRMESCYAHPTQFIPERWYSQPELVRDSRAFKPFGNGRYGCVGKNLALRELRFVIALLISKYTVAFAPDEDGAAVVRDMRDFFTAAPGKLRLVFEPVAGDEKAGTADVRK